MTNQNEKTNQDHAETFWRELFPQLDAGFVTRLAFCFGDDVEAPSTPHRYALIGEVLDNLAYQGDPQLHANFVDDGATIYLAEGEGLSFLTVTGNPQ